MEKEELEYPQSTSKFAVMEKLTVPEQGNTPTNLLGQDHGRSTPQQQSQDNDDSEVDNDNDNGVGLESQDSLSEKGEHSMDDNDVQVEIRSPLGEGRIDTGNVENNSDEKAERVEVEMENEEIDDEVKRAEMKKGDEKRQSESREEVDMNEEKRKPTPAAKVTAPKASSKGKESLSSRPIKKLKLDVTNTNIIVMQNSPVHNEAKNTLSLSDHQKLLAENERKKMEEKSKASNKSTSPFHSSSPVKQKNAKAAKTNAAVLAAALQARKQMAKKSERKASLKRARPRKRVIPASDDPSILDLSPPVSTDTSWNASEILKDFLFVGAGWDQNGRCLVNRVGDPPALVTERLDWCRRHNLIFNLNMAGSPLQKELEGINYPLPEAVNISVDVNDVDCWANEMEEAFDKGAEFLQMTWNEHMKQKKLAKEQQAKYPNSQVVMIPPTVFVHCVAGVNRSPFVVVWWMVRYHGIHLLDAWELVRRRRDSGARWTDITLGGAAPPMNYAPDIKIMYTNKAVRRFQHTVAVLPGNSPTLDDEGIMLDEFGNNTSSNFDAVVSATSAHPHPKYFWYINCDRVLKQYYKRRHTEQ
eukprot:CAMPEP_0204862662 /NCGR_PEP_ID=MMETSP1348-20121228/2714_1 /ASSEMBLY_ACC=CAM_ASM_000700 /TAXON_ID=215587 /ORGANISM="Aplanochytrium stocchinoi, Strain GSBS06" /LENGTH=584 /DNA_ID=CAMNT_0052012725 /DNA_START=425 /DNA_END=2179 /DNA_ORIENTATION=-